MMYGYARVSTSDQTTEAQRKALTAAGCVEIFEDVSSGANTTRPGLTKLMATLKPGDVMVVWKLDRLGRSLSDLIRTLASLEEQKVQFRSLTEAMDTTTELGRMIFHVAGAFAQFERGLIVERTKEKLAFARQQGIKLGRRPALSHVQLQQAEALIEQGHSPERVATSFNVHPSTLRRARAKAKEKITSQSEAA